MHSVKKRISTAETQIHLRRVFEHDPTELYSETDLRRIRIWNKHVDSEEGTDLSVFLSHEAYWKTKSRRTAKLYLSELYNAIQYDSAKREYDEKIRSNTYTAGQICEWFSAVNSEQTIHKYLDILVEIGLLRRTEDKQYIKATGQFGPIFETIAVEGTLPETELKGFPELPDCTVVERTQPGSLLKATFNRYFPNEHIVGWVLLTSVISLMTRLLLSVTQTGTVTPTDLVLAGVVAWLGLIGVFALCIGILRRGHDGIASLRQYRSI